MRKEKMTQNLDIIRKLKQHSKVENKKPLPVTSVSTAQYNPPQTTSTINVQVNVQQPQPQVQIPPSQQKIYYTQPQIKVNLRLLNFVCSLEF